jgi:hypothetical protein
VLPYEVEQLVMIRELRNIEAYEFTEPRFEAVSPVRHEASRAHAPQGRSNGGQDHELMQRVGVDQSAVEIDHQGRHGINPLEDLRRHQLTTADIGHFWRVSM